SCFEVDKAFRFVIGSRHHQLLAALVGYAVGFESINSFSNLFKSKTGLPPSVFRKATFDKSKR
ncbi:MAG: hypothetical protein AAFO94_10870, partial [Bacteroidota bacterium]